MSRSNTRCVAGQPAEREQYQRLMQNCAVVDFSDRTQIEFRGGDRQRFLHNLCTNDIQRLQSGQGCEAFVTSVQGKCLGHILVFAGDDSLVLETSPGQAEKLLSHFDRYLITEDVQLVDRSQDWAELLLGGPEAPRHLSNVGCQAEALPEYAHQAVHIEGQAVWVRCAPMTGVPTFLLACRRTELSAVQTQLISLGVTNCSLSALQMAQIEKGFPWYSWDVTDQNLPQEVHRDDVAISFTKGCYLGQETVARIDALGHVNRLLVAVRGDVRDVPDHGAELSLDGQIVGQVTSAAYSPRLEAPLALAYVRRQYCQPGTSLQLPSGRAEVVALPL